MKKLIPFLALLVAISCTKKSSKPDVHITKPGRTIDLHSYATMGLDSPFLSTDTANVMIGSYLNSIETHPYDLKSITVDGDALRYYLQNTDIKHVKIMFAHKLGYVRNGGANQYVGTDYRKLTIVIAGYGEDNDYIYSPQGAVMDFGLPCPVQCPTSGTASSHLLQ